MALSHAIIQIPVPPLTRKSLSGILIVLGLRENLAGFHQIRTLGAVLSFASLAQASCGRARQSEGERLARTYCTPATLSLTRNCSTRRHGRRASYRRWPFESEQARRL